MSSITVFAFENQEIRFVDGKPVANDVAKALGYKNPAKTVSTRVGAKNKTTGKLSINGRIRSVALLTEAGVLQLISTSRLPNAIDLAKRLGMYCFSSVKEQDTIRVLAAAFSDLDPITQYSVAGYSIDLYLDELRVAIECDEHDHRHYNSKAEAARETEIKRLLNCEFVRFNPDAPDFNIGDVIKKVRDIEALDRQFPINTLCNYMPILNRADSAVAQWADDVFWKARDAYLKRDLPEYIKCVARLDEFVATHPPTIV